jgi:S-adenosyl methyltransferase
MTEGDRVDSEEFPDAVSDEDPAFDQSASHQARVYNYLLGGKDHFAADRAYADALISVYPGTVAGARANRDFLGRVVRFFACDVGLSQFLDIGTGIPAPGSTHEVAQKVRPDSRIVYVDNDPVVLSHARALLVGSEPGATDYLDADLRDSGLILSKAARTLDFSQPVGLLLIAILHAIGDHDDPYRIVATLMDALPSGSYLAITHWGTNQANPEAETKVGKLTRQMSHQQYNPRSQAEVARFFDGLDVVEPGIVRPQNWRPGPRDEPVSDIVGWAGVARKPLRKETE